MSEHVSEARMHEALDGALSAEERGTLERHLDECVSCRDAYARFSETVAAVRSLPRSGRPPEALWEGIRARIEDTARTEEDEAGASVVALPSAERVERPTHGSAAGGGRTTVRMTLPQLAAAAAVVAFVSVGLARFVPEGSVPSATPAVERDERPGGAAARAVSFDASRYGETVRSLEAILSEGRDVLAPETLERIEGSLETVDAAIADIEAALAEDPGSDLLQRLLASHQSTKLGVLQRAVTAVQSET